MSVDWENLHKIGRRPWDLLGVTPMLKFFCESDHKGKEIIEELKANARILIPGCGQVNSLLHCTFDLIENQDSRCRISRKITSQLANNCLGHFQKCR